jgi:hypothetical protein
MKRIEDESVSGLIFTEFDLVTGAELLINEFSNERVLSQFKVVWK